jgi:dTDP-4-dehydrorhamnose reductase
MKSFENMRVFIAGCGGMLGKAVYERFSPYCQVLATDIDVNEPWRRHRFSRNIKKGF